MKSLVAALVFAVVVLGVAGSPQSANAQSPIRGRYVPRRPVFSPYMDYFRRDTGLMDPYNTFRSRQIRQNQIYRQQQQQMQFQQKKLQQQRLELQQVQGAVRQFRESGASPTGHGSTFMNFSHYFGAGSAGQASPQRSR